MVEAGEMNMAENERQPEGSTQAQIAPTVGVESTFPKTMPEDHSALPVWNAENWFYEDFAIGHRIRSLRRTIAEGESMQFNALVLDMHPYVGDQIFAEAEGMFGRRLVAGAFVFSAGLGLVATNCVNAFSYGYDRLRFIKPVFIGDTIYTIRTNLDKQPKYDELGLIRASYEVFKGEGELVLYCEHIQTVRYRDGKPASA
jgi:acyl dehydratase